MTNLILGLLGLLCIWISGGIGMYLDIKKEVKSPQLYWLIGVIGGVIGGAIFSFFILLI